MPWRDRLGKRGPAAFFFDKATSQPASAPYNGVKIEDTLRVLSLIDEHLARGDAHSARHVARGILKDAGVQVGPWLK